MKRRARVRRAPDGPPLSPAEIDRLYGLEPVFEPGRSGTHITETEPVSVSCPYCGERVHTRVDLSSDEASYIEDCQVCCQPMAISIGRTAQGALDAVTAKRSDD